MSQITINKRQQEQLRKGKPCKQDKTNQAKRFSKNIVLCTRQLLVRYV